MITVKLPVVDPKLSFRDKMDGSVSNGPYEVVYDDLDDARDKLTHKFINSGPFALIAGTDVGVYEIHSMNALDMLQNILDIYGQMFQGEDVKLNGVPCSDSKDFEQAVFKVCSMIEQVSGERSSAFEKKVESQAMSHQEECDKYGAKYGFGELKNNYPGA